MSKIGLLKGWVGPRALASKVGVSKQIWVCDFGVKSIHMKYENSPNLVLIEYWTQNSRPNDGCLVRHLVLQSYMYHILPFGRKSDARTRSSNGTLAYCSLCPRSLISHVFRRVSSQKDHTFFVFFLLGGTERMFFVWPELTTFRKLRTLHNTI